jgi:hypothetical protein
MLAEGMCTCGRGTTPGSHPRYSPAGFCVPVSTSTPRRGCLDGSSGTCAACRPAADPRFSAGAIANGTGSPFTLPAGFAPAQSQGNSTALGLLNGWLGAPFATRPAATVDLSGTIHLSGAIATGGANPTAFTLPAAFAPATDVYVPVDLCNTTKGRLVISGGSGMVSVQAENGTFSNAQCFTSLDGAFYSP